MRVWSHRRLSPEESGVVGIVGEMHAYRFLRKEFGGERFTPAHGFRSRG